MKTLVGLYNVISLRYIFIDFLDLPDAIRYSSMIPRDKSNY
jgi:hypothetical protein